MRMEIKLVPTYYKDVMDIWQNILANNAEEWADTDSVNRARQVRMFLFGMQVALRIMNMDSAAEEIVKMFLDILTNDCWKITPEWDISVIAVSNNTNVQHTNGHLVEN